MASWSENSKFILEAIERIEKKLDANAEHFERHVESDAKELASIKTTLKWQNRIGGGIITGMVSVIGWLFHRGQ